jgi:hypothetical protein
MYVNVSFAYLLTPCITYVQYSTTCNYYYEQGTRKDEGLAYLHVLPSKPPAGTTETCIALRVK